MTDSHLLSRRAVLRGAGAMVCLPFLESLAPRSLGAAGPAAVKPPLRLGIVSTTGGTVLESWRPAAEGSLTRLPSILRPLEFARDDLLVLSGLSHNGRSENLNGHEHCAYLHLTGAPLARKASGKFQAGISVDQAAARVAGENTYLSSLEIGLSNHETRYSFRSPEVPVPYEANPRLVFERMFRGRTPIVPNWQLRGGQPAATVRESARSDSLERSVLDLVREEANDLRRRLGHSDKQRLEEYLHAVRSVEKRVDFVEKRQQQEVLDAAHPGPSRLNLPTNLPPEGLPVWKITHPVTQDTERHAEYLRLMSDLIVLAFQTDTTRVATLAMGSDEALFHGVVTVGYERHCHTLEHQGNAGRVEDADPIAREACRQIHAWYTMLFAELVRKMKDIDEGGSSLLDNTLLLYTSYMADGGHGVHNYPVLLAGKAGGTLKTGRHLRYKERTPVSNLYLEILDRMGASVKSFGETHASRYAAYDGRLPGLV
jgi:hypothetical protein